MKGIILAGGEGNRLKPLTAVTNKHLLPIYNKPMIFYPLETLTKAGIRDILVITGPKYAGMFLQLLGSGEKFGCRLQFRVQEKAEGIAHALGLTKTYVGDDNCAVILGDNIFEDDISDEIRQFKGQKGGKIFLKEMEDANRFGIAELKGKKVINIEEKPKHPKSNYAVTGLYLYDPSVFRIIAELSPSRRGEYEITDVNNAYIKRNELKAKVLKNRWTDAGTFESLYRANKIIREMHLENIYGVNGKRDLEHCYANDVVKNNKKKNYKK
jgi:glucose-1-phosphate thymidylyltransferase